MLRKCNVKNKPSFPNNLQSARHSARSLTRIISFISCDNCMREVIIFTQLTDQKSEVERESNRLKEVRGAEISIRSIGLQRPCSEPQNFHICESQH